MKPASTITTTTVRAPHRLRASGSIIAAARETALPLVVHSRDCDTDMAQILREESGQGAFPAVLHCFTAGRDLAFTAIESGHYVSFTGILTFKAQGHCTRVLVDCSPDLRLQLLDAEVDWLDGVLITHEQLSTASLADAA